ncbi:MAG: HutD family protein [Anaerovoracaceae bacterium]
MDYTIYKNESFQSKSWSGGSTKEFAIFPPEAEYGNRDFLWRLSSATVAQEESKFTFLPDYDRVIIVLEGDVILTYEGERVVRLKALEQDRFDGGYRTKSFGKITDYNLMVRKGNQGHLSVVKLGTEKTALDFEDPEEYEQNVQGIYCHEGYSVVTFGKESCMLNMGDQLIIHYDKEEEVNVGIMGEGKAIHAQIFFNDMSLGPEIIPPEPICIDDYIQVMKISLTRFRGSHYIFKFLREVWFDEILKKKINIIERPAIPFFLWLIVLALGIMLGYDNYVPSVLILGGILWTLVDVLIVNPAIYLIVLPKPVGKHMKPVDTLTEYEKGVLEKESKTNPIAERILKKYKITARNVYLPDKPKKKK